MAAILEMKPEANIIVWLNGATGKTHYTPFLCEAEQDGRHLLEIEFLFCHECPAFYKQMEGLGINPERGDRIAHVLSKDLTYLEKRLDPFF